MTQHGDHPVTQILEAAVGGDPDAVNRLLTLVYDELRGLAHARLSGLTPGQSLRPTDLVHEAYIKLVGNDDRTWENRRHFINAAGTAMRSILVDRARARMTIKRGGDRQREPLHDDAAVFNRDPAEVIAMNEALEALTQEDERAAQVVSLRIFLGMAESEIADVLGVTDRTVQRDWKYAKAWLATRMKGESRASRDAAK
ncbi:MAG: sigma-70 family RNA polymerase sigma factor [Planctomycetota bacterium]